MSRAEFSRKTKVLAFERCAGHCEKCGMKLKAGTGEYDHIIPAALGGEASLENCQVLCIPCHRGTGAKTADDVKIIAKVKRMRDKHNGTMKTKTTFKRPAGKFNWSSGRYERDK